MSFIPSASLGHASCLLSWLLLTKLGFYFRDNDLEGLHSHRRTKELAEDVFFWNETQLFVRDLSRDFLHFQSLGKAAGFGAALGWTGQCVLYHGPVFLTGLNTEAARGKERVTLQLLKDLYLCRAATSQLKGSCRHCTTNPGRSRERPFLHYAAFPSSLRWGENQLPCRGVSSLCFFPAWRCWPMQPCSSVAA